MAPNESIAKECTILFCDGACSGNRKHLTSLPKTIVGVSHWPRNCKNLRRRNKMIKTTYSTMLLVIGFLALMLMLPSAHLNAEPIDNPNDSPASSISNVNQTDIKGLNQSESPLLMAQTTEEHRSSESSSSSTVETPPPVQEQHSSESSSSTTKSYDRGAARALCQSLS